MKIEVTQTSIKEKTILRNLMQLYLYDFSGIDGGDVDNTGLFSYRYLDHYWTESGRYPFLVRISGHLAGFALLRKGTYFSERDQVGEPGMTTAEFFVMKRYHRQGVGSHVAIQLFNRFKGRWEIAQALTNSSGRAFWRAIIAEYTGGNYTEISLDNERWKGTVQVFDNSIP